VVGWAARPIFPKAKVLASDASSDGAGWSTGPSAPYAYAAVIKFRLRDNLDAA
jgi:hypothetical protein